MAADTPTPPRPRLVLRIGIVGHRPHRLIQANIPDLRTHLHTLLTTIAQRVLEFAEQQGERFAEGFPVVRVVTPLAEGTDRLFADAAFEVQEAFRNRLQFEMCCPIPFAQAAYERDFADPDPTAEPTPAEQLRKQLEGDSRKRFRDLLERARHSMNLQLFEMDGAPGQPAAYGACGRVVLHQSDLLLAIWDGVRENKIGGTEELISYALLREVPVLWIDAKAPHAMQFLDPKKPLPHATQTPATPETPCDLAAIAQVTAAALEIPEPKDDHAHHNARTNGAALTAFHKEHKPRVNLGIGWRYFRSLVGDFRVPLISPRIPDFESSVESEWPRIIEDNAAAAGTIPRSKATSIDRARDWLRRFYAWPDRLSVYYSDAYRTAFVTCYILAAVAVGVALLPLVIGESAERPCILAELILIVSILVLVWQGHRRQWHERWIEYRLAAELIRHTQIVVPLGGGRPFPQPPAHLAQYGHPGSTWMAWYVRAIERDLGLLSARVDQEYVDQCRQKAITVLEDQVDFHHGTYERTHRLEHHLHYGGLTLLFLTLAVCILHFALTFAHHEPPAKSAGETVPAEVAENHMPTSAPVMHPEEPRHDFYGGLLTFLSGFLPAAGAALAGINNQGEFTRIAKRSKGMANQLRNLVTELNSLTPHAATADAPQYSQQVEATVNKASQLMINEVMDWRVVFLDRPLSPPA